MLTIRVEPTLIYESPDHVWVVCRLFMCTPGARERILVRWYDEEMTYDDIEADVAGEFAPDKIVMQYCWYLPRTERPPELPF